MSFPADSTFDSGQGSTVYSDSQSSQQSAVLGSLADAAPPPTQCVCSPPVSATDGPVLPYSLPSLGPYQQPAVVSQPLPPWPGAPQAARAALARGQAPGRSTLLGRWGLCAERPTGWENRSVEPRPQSFVAVAELASFLVTTPLVPLACLAPLRGSYVSPGSSPLVTTQPLNVRSTRTAELWGTCSATVDKPVG